MLRSSLQVYEFSESHGLLLRSIHILYVFYVQVDSSASLFNNSGSVFRYPVSMRSQIQTSETVENPEGASIVDWFERGSPDFDMAFILLLRYWHQFGTKYFHRIHYITNPITSNTKRRSLKYYGKFNNILGRSTYIDF